LTRKLPPVERFETNAGAQIYRLPVEAFPGGFIAYCYVILEAGEPTLIDTGSGSGFGFSNDDLLDGIRALSVQFGLRFAQTDIRRILITHGHIDHFGGVNFAVEQTGARVGIHPLDRRVLTNYEERVIVATKDLRVYLERAGVKPHLMANLIDMYAFAKQHVRSVPVDFMLEESIMLDRMHFIHTPGHCPGQVCILLDDMLLSADHVLSRTSPHQAPESITNYTGLGHYLTALDKLAHVPDIRLALGGHEDPIPDLYARIEEIKASHQRKLNRVLDAIRDAEQPISISDLSKHLYAERHGYDILLALEEVGAHVEYLYEHGQLAICNLHQVEQEDNPTLLYGLA